MGKEESSLDVSFLDAPMLCSIVMGLSLSWYSYGYLNINYYLLNSNFKPEISISVSVMSSVIGIPIFPNAYVIPVKLTL